MWAILNKWRMAKGSQHLLPYIKIGGVYKKLPSVERCIERKIRFIHTFLSFIWTDVSYAEIYLWLHKVYDLKIYTDIKYDHNRQPFLIRQFEFQLTTAKSKQRGSSDIDLWHFKQAWSRKIHRTLAKLPPIQLLWKF